jgi:hypothetical protein
MLSEITTSVLERVCQYFYYKLQYQNSYDLILLPLMLDRGLERSLSVAFTVFRQKCRSTPALPDFKVEPEMALSMLVAADYLDT